MSAPTRRSATTGRDLSPRTLACRRRDQLTKALDDGAVLVAITVAQFYLSGMSQRTLADDGKVWRKLPVDNDIELGLRRRPE